MRTYENDLASLTLVGAVDFQQALTAAAADGGQAADEHIKSGMPAMVVETLFPGSSDQHSTVSTRLVSSFLMTMEFSLTQWLFISGKFNQNKVLSFTLMGPFVEIDLFFGEGCGGESVLLFVCNEPINYTEKFEFLFDQVLKGPVGY